MSDEETIVDGGKYLPEVEFYDEYRRPIVEQYAVRDKNQIQTIINRFLQTHDEFSNHKAEIEDMAAKIEYFQFLNIPMLIYAIDILSETKGNMPDPKTFKRYIERYSDIENKQSDFLRYIRLVFSKK